MDTSAISKPTHRKLIDIPEDVFKVLSIKATSMGMNLKKYIETLLTQEANEMDDAEIYRYLVESCPDGKEMLSTSEKNDFMRRHGLGQYR